MKPVLILQNANNDWPDYFEEFLKGASFPYVVVNAGQGQCLPARLDDYSGFGLMGGAMGANDETLYPHLASAYVLLKQAIDEKIPVMGHCLGGQMLARALGATVSQAKLPEIGWHEIRPTNSELASHWLGLSPSRPFKSMQWHYDEFSLPSNATLLAASQYGAHQAFVSQEIFLGMQFHIEARAEKITAWLADERSSASIPNGLNCHDDGRIQADTQEWEPRAKWVADHIYGRWLEKVKGLALTPAGV